MNGPFAVFPRKSLQGCNSVARVHENWSNPDSLTAWAKTDLLGTPRFSVTKFPRHLVTKVSPACCQRSAHVGSQASATAFPRYAEPAEELPETGSPIPLMAALYAAAVQRKIAMEVDAGQPVVRLGNAALAADPVDAGSTRCAALGGFSLHAGVAIGASDRAGLERVCRYMGRPPLASERLERLSDGRILYRLRHRWRDGTSALILEPREFMARLAAQVPPPRAHQVRYHGVLAPCAAWRPYVVPGADDAVAAIRRPSCSHDRPQASRARRIAWSDLLRRVFAVDALRCDRCGSKMRVMAAVRSPAATAALLACIGSAGRSPPASRYGGSAA